MGQKASIVEASTTMRIIFIFYSTNAFISDDNRKCDAPAVSIAVVGRHLGSGYPNDINGKNLLSKVVLQTNILYTLCAKLERQ